MANIELLDATMTAIDASLVADTSNIIAPLRGNQNVWWEQTDCGTTMCFAGWVAHIAVGSGRKYDQAAQLLGLSPIESAILFAPNWTLEQLRGIVSWIAGRSGSTDLDLNWAYLHRADLGGADLHRADLGGANLHGADLHGADLHGADLHWADLHRANLHGADLHGADLHWADLHGADLHGADLGGAVLCGADLSGAELSGADLSGADLSGAELSGAELSGAELGDDDLEYDGTPRTTRTNS